MTLTKFRSQLLLHRQARLARTIALLLGVTIMVAAQTEQGMAQGAEMRSEAYAALSVASRVGTPAAPHASVTAVPPFMTTDAAGVTPPAPAASVATTLLCADTGKAPTAAFGGPPYKDPVPGLSAVFHLGANLGSPIVRTLVPVSYPPALQAKGTQGTVNIHYWVNPSGCAEPGSFQVKQASDSAMAVAVRNAVRRLHFVERGPSGEMLWASVVQAFTFRITP
jgi:hypothetical protein